MLISQRKTKTQTTLQEIPSGKAGVNTTLKIMRQLVRANKTDISIRELALSLVKGNKQKDWLNEIKNIHEYVRDKIRYVRDIDGIETIQTPERTIYYGQGDCDDKSVLVATLLATIGHPTRFVAIGLQPGSFCHVYVETKIANKWIGVETTENVPLGWQPSGIRERMVMYN